MVSGGTGFIGSALTDRLIDEGHELFILSRNPQKKEPDDSRPVTFLKWNAKDSSGWGAQAEGMDLIIHLAGETIAGLRWTDAKKKRIIQSRIDAGSAIVEAVRKWERKPAYLIQASAIGYYGDRQEPVDEKSDKGEGFFPEVCERWEESTQEVETMGVNRAVIRMGVVLGKEGGILKRILLPFRLGLGGPVGSGKQMMSWIHIDDVINAIVFLAKRREQGVFNLTCENPVEMKEFTRALAKTLHRPHLIPVPGFLLKLVMGKEMAEEIILTGAPVFPKRLLDLEYKFKYNNIYSAFTDLV